MTTKIFIAGLIFMAGWMCVLFACSEIIVPISDFKEMVFRTSMLCLFAFCQFVVWCLVD